MVSKRKAEEVLLRVESMGLDDAIEHYGIKKDSILRYVRTAKLAIKSDEPICDVPKILFFDIETTPMISYHWALWKQNIDFVKQTIQDSKIICYSAKWYGHTDVIHDCCTKQEMLSGDDSRVAKSLWELLDSAEVCVAHNLIKFDRRKANTRFIVNGLTPPTPYKLIDTLQKVKQEFAFPSNRLDAINKILGLERKRDTGGFELWEKCMGGDQEALDHMQFYCDGDIVALEETYNVLAPWFRSNVNFGVFNNIEVEMCSHCGSQNLRLSHAKYFTGVSRFPMYTCNLCGGHSRARFSELTLNKRKNLLTALGS
jgi:DNA polymerase III epsilon subunit-like protein